MSFQSNACLNVERAESKQQSEVEASKKKIYELIC